MTASLTETSFNHLLVEERGPTAWVKVNRPLDRNSVNSQVMVELDKCLSLLEAGQTRAVVFTGAGENHFIGGADGIEMMACDPDQALAFSRRIQAVYDRLEASPLITVAAINGLCFGGGFELALACDLRVASSSARIGLPEVKVGLIPGGGGTQRLPRLIGTGAALEMILSGRLYEGSEAAGLGLVHLTVKPEELGEGVERLLAPILARPAYAVSLAKAAVRAAWEGDRETGLAAEGRFFSRCFEHDFFPRLMVDQLEKGLLTTSLDADELVRRFKR